MAQQTPEQTREIANRAQALHQAIHTQTPEQIRGTCQAAAAAWNARRDEAGQEARR